MTRRNTGVLPLLNPCAGIRILYRHSVYTYITSFIRCYIGHNPVNYNIRYIARYITFFGCITYHILQTLQVKIQSVVIYAK